MKYETIVSRLILGSIFSLWKIKDSKRAWKCMDFTILDTNIWPDLLIALLAVGDWIAKGAAQRGRTEGAVLPARRSTPEYDPCMTSEHSTTARWIKLGVDFEEGGNRSARRKPSKSSWDRLKLSPRTTFVVEVGGVFDVHYASLTSQGVQHRRFIQMVTHPDMNPVQQNTEIW